MKQVQSNKIIQGRSVPVHGTDIAKALRKLKKIMTNENILNEVRSRQEFEKPTAKRKKAKAAAKKRTQTQQAKSTAKHKRLY